MGKRLAVLVSIYNSGEWLENRLNNLLGTTTIRDTEILCLNANSPDPRDDEIARRFQLAYDNIRYTKLDQRIGVYAAWNELIKSTDATYLTNANTDDLVAPHCYERLMGVLDGDRGAGFAYPSWYCTARANQTWHTLCEIDPGGHPGQYYGNIDVAGVGHFPLWRRSLHDSLGLFDDRFKALGDADWWARCYHRGKVKFVWLNEMLACYLWRAGQNLWHQEISESEWALYRANLQTYQNG